MKSRVAFIATLIALVILALVFMVNCSRLADERNMEYRDNLNILCETTGDFSRSDTMEERVQMLKMLSMGDGMVCGLYSAADGSAIYVSDEGYPQLEPEDMAVAKSGTTVSGHHNTSEGKAVLYAIYQYEDGAFLVFARRMADVWTVLSHDPALIAFAIVFGLCMVLFISVLLNVMTRERRVNQVMHALDSFSDGNFDARIVGFSERDPDTAEYNAIITRIQDRARAHVLMKLLKRTETTYSAR